ncbi:hypothetical protein Glove_629g6 [Diversispora epigaea]|uniref:Uncharacterized protein n=1 Tax=Diversispora epigaea TaxID=1348612 RepID=A0A397GDN8_9GLOM|nr:hypothetical protein Glove_629g6 [Diversispora epigaea]
MADNLNDQERPTTKKLRQARRKAKPEEKRIFGPLINCSKHLITVIEDDDEFDKRDDYDRSDDDSNADNNFAEQVIELDNVID